VQGHADEVRKAVAAPGELSRLQVLRRHLDQYIDLITKRVPFVPAELIFDLDETAFSNWEDSTAKPVLIPTNLGEPMIYYPVNVNRQIRHQTHLCCVSASGGAYSPLLVSTKESVSQVLDMGIRNEIYIRIRIAQSRYLTKRVFIEHMRDVVVPTVEANRDHPGCQAKPSIIFWKCSSGHCSDDVLQELANNGSLVITYRPHPLHISQLLDVILFGRLKSAKKYPLGN
jgi:hypothetical protein